MGDIRLSGPIGRVVEQHGSSAPLSQIQKWLGGDIVFGNLEEPLPMRGEPADKTWVFRSSPSALSLLRGAGFTVLNLANNHVRDYDSEGLEDTLSALRDAGILSLGAGMDGGQARRPVFIEKNGLRIGLIAFISTIPRTNWAGLNKAGVAYSDFRRFRGWIREAKAACDVLVVSFHGGTEKESSPNRLQRDFAKAAVEAGADVVIGRHPHMVQSAEIIDGKLVLHSLGNFLFVSPTPATRWTVIARLSLSRSGVSAELVPVDIHYGTLRPAGPEGVEVLRSALDGLGALTLFPERVRLVGTSGD